MRTKTWELHAPHVFLLSLLLLFPNLTFSRDLSDEEKGIIGKAVTRDLIDPESARFKWIPLSSSYAQTQTYCGIVNAKNRLGGYTGDAPYIMFLILGPDQTVKAAVPIRIGTNDSNAPSSVAVLTQCEKQGYTRLFLAE